MTSPINSSGPSLSACSSSYGSAIGKDRTLVAMSVPRQMLHAWRLRFSHPTTGHTISVSAKLPKDFLDCLQACGWKD